MGKGKHGGYKSAAQRKAVHASKKDGGKGHPGKQNHVKNIDSLATAERKKHDATRPKPVPVNDSTGTAPVLPKPVKKPSFKDKVNNFMKMFAKGAGYSNL